MSKAVDSLRPLKCLAKSAAALLFVAISSTACTPAPVVSDACGWLEPVHPDADFAARWTPDELRQVDALDNKIVAHCPQLAPQP